MNRYCNGVIHTVRKGDTLYSLSRQYDVPLVAILRANPYVDIYNLMIGSRICIPTGPQRPPEVPLNRYPDESRMDSQERMWMDDMDMQQDRMRKEDVDVDDDNDNDRRIAYVVKEGESMKDILDKFGEDAEDFLENNNLADILLKPGITVFVEEDR